MSSAKYSNAVDIAMIFMSSMLVAASSVNMKIYNSADSFKMDASGKPAKSGMTLGLRPAGVNTMAIITSILGSMAIGIFGLSVVSGGASRAKAPKVTTALFGFAIALALLLTGMSSIWLDKQVEAYESDESAAAKVRAAARARAPVARSAAMSKKYNTKAKVVGGLSIAMGSVVLALFIARVAAPKARTAFRSNRVAPLTGGTTGASTFFKY